MSRCPPPLGPMCWGGRSSTCQASSPTVSATGPTSLGSLLCSLAPGASASSKKGTSEWPEAEELSGSLLELQDTGWFLNWALVVLGEAEILYR